MASVPVSFPVPPRSTASFADGAQFRVELASIEGPRALEAVITACGEFDVTVNRVSQGSGGMLLTSGELRDMASMAAEAGIEVCIFVGPRAEWDTGAFSRSEEGNSQMGAICGMRQIEYALDDVHRCVAAGIRGFVVGDLGLLDILAQKKRSGELPPELTLKVSVVMGVSNASTVKVLEGLGATSINVVPDIGLEALSEMRAASTLPLDLYIESPDGMGGMIRIPELSDVIAVAAPVHAKFALRNSSPLLPAGLHNRDYVCAVAREKVRRVACALEFVGCRRATVTQSEPFARGLSIPQVEATEQRQ